MRVSFNMIYSQSVSGMNRNLAELMRINEQSASQKRINRPSDDPEGMARTLDLSSTISTLERNIENIDTAEAWLTLADDVLGQASDVLTRLQEICEQGATGSYSDAQREEIAMEARELFEELVSLSNTEYAGDSIFAGSNTDADAYVMGLGATVSDGDGASLEVLEVTGAADSTIYVEFLDSGEVGADALRYRYSTDGGDTWEQGTLAAGDTTLDCGTAQAVLANGSTVTATAEEGSGEGTALWLRPTGIYQGNTDDDLSVLHYGVSSVEADAQGVFSSDVMVRIDDGGTLPGPFSYSYSLDNGNTWSTGHETSNSSFQVPGGFLSLASNGGSSLAAGDQFSIRSEHAAITVDIGTGSEVQINNVGRDIFGGLHTPAGADYAVAAGAENGNMFEAVGELIGYLESNNLDGIGDCLDDLAQAHEVLTVALGNVGGRENRLEFARVSAETLVSTATANISDIEDADVTQLTTNLAKAQYAYEAVLESSSIIMNLSLLDYM